MSQAAGLLLLATTLVAVPAEFPAPEALEPNVRFWESVYSRYRSDQVVIHDTRHLDVVYHVFDLGPFWLFPDTGTSEERLARRAGRKAKIEEELARVGAALGEIEAARRRGARPEGFARELHDRLEEAGRLEMIAGAAGRLRWQYGLADRFQGGIARFEAWEELVTAEFAAAGLPRELTALPFVESLFDPGARSHVGAAGILQLMPATARELGLRRGPGYDERRDPILAARAAARMLRRNYERLGNWPLALTGYNHGPNGVARGVRQVGSSDLIDLIARYSSPSWGFASENFYAEFLAARRVLDARAEHFGDWVASPPVRLHPLELPRSATLDQLYRGPCLEQGEQETFARLNPALDEAALAGRISLPQGLRVYLPRDPAPRSASACLAKRVLASPKLEPPEPEPAAEAELEPEVEPEPEPEPEVELEAPPEPEPGPTPSLAEDPPEEPAVEPADRSEDEGDRESEDEAETREEGGAGPDGPTPPSSDPEASAG
ncbi:MAG: lytic transglycosylase domain-containing protein [Deltaproteobacteria bacterium]|nr:lytic transglycosylase domain-containing protein [Deltaproteobacteria bacterium]